VNTQSQPSSEYEKLLRYYRAMHAPAPWRYFLNSFRGYSIAPFLTLIQALIEEHNSKTLLDYGSGAGDQYNKVVIRKKGSLRFFGRLANYWKVKVTCYDPAVPKYRVLPAGRFDAVISTDVLEHIFIDDIDWVLDEVFRRASQFVFINVSCCPSSHVLPDGGNAHVTLRNPDWWAQQVAKTAARFPELKYYLAVTGQGGKWENNLFSNAPFPVRRNEVNLFPATGGWSYFIPRKIKSLL
jgi:hypothetical protein